MQPGGVPPAGGVLRQNEEQWYMLICVTYLDSPHLDFLNKPNLTGLCWPWAEFLSVGAREQSKS